MRQFIKRALQRLEKLSPEQIRDLLLSSSGEIDRLETVIDSLPRGILVCDKNHKLILANKAARRFLSISSYDQAREFVWNVVAEEEVSEFLAHTISAADRAEESEFSVSVGGRERLLSVSIMPLVQNQSVSGSLILVDDITDRRGREAAMRRMESLASLTTLAAGVAHEIKNPLGALSIHVQLIQKTMKTDRENCQPDNAGQGMCIPREHIELVDRYLEIVNEEVDRLSGIVTDFLFAVRPINVELRRGDINPLLRDLMEFASLELKDAGIESVLNLADDIPALDFDERLMKQTLLNLIKNAAAAMSTGGKLVIASEAGDGEVIITIADNGTGIPEKDLVKIFEPYYTTKETGTGLGLTMAFKIVKEHNGEISVKSREGEGTVFTITLPISETGRRLIEYRKEAS